MDSRGAASVPPAAAPILAAQSKPNSKFGGVQVGACPTSFVGCSGGADDILNEVLSGSVDRAERAGTALQPGRGSDGRLLVLTTMAALGRWEEFRMHVRTGLASGLELKDIEEVLLQAAVYASLELAR